MKPERNFLTVESNTPPTLEIDGDANAIYIRFSKSKVVKTVITSARHSFATVDLDASNKVIGIEIIGFDNLQIHRLLEIAKVKAPRIDYAKMRIRATPVPA